MENNNGNKMSYIPRITIKKIETNQSKTYTDSSSTIELLDKLSIVTNRSFNDVLKGIVKDFLDNGEIYDEENNSYIPIKDISTVFGDEIERELEIRKNKSN